MVEITETVTYRIPVKAKDRDQAERKAQDIWENDGANAYYFASDWEVDHVREVKP
jgi:hypothetical protein